MKKILLICLLNPFISFSQSCIPSIYPPSAGNPYVYYATGYCYGLLDRYLSRSIMETDLVNHLNLPDYCDQINLISTLQPAYFSRIAGGWGSQETTLLPGGTYYIKTMQVISDINKVYQSLGLRLPIIEGGIYEAVTCDINNIAVPQFVLNAFQSDQDFINAGYVSNPPSNFNWTQMMNPAEYPGSGAPYLYSWDNSNPNSCQYIPDITQIQTRMWYYYLSTILIDMGCNSIHLGWWQLVFGTDYPQYLKTYPLLQLVRNYAQNAGTFVIFNADIDRAPYYNSTQQLVLDFLSSPVRPDPTNNSYTGLPCDGQYMTELNLTGISPLLLNNGGGITPTGCSIEHIPVLFNLDFGGDSYAGVPPSLGMGQQWDPWGVSETIWFYLLTPDCQAYWLKNVACALKNDVVNRGYLKMPGMQDLDWWGNPLGVSEYHMADYPQVVDAVQNTIWKVNENNYFTITVKCEDLSCTGQTVWTYHLKVTNPDCSSIYTWHVLNLTTNTWLNYTFGDERILSSLSPDTYKIQLRIDNIAFPYNNDVKYVEKEIVVGESSCSPPVQKHSNIKNPQNNMVKKNSANSQYKDNPDNSLNGDINTQMSLSIYPNPAKESLTIYFSLNKTDNIDVLLTDITGKTVKTFIINRAYSSGSNSISESIDDVLSGTYFIQLKTSSGNLIKKLTVIK